MCGKPPGGFVPCTACDVTHDPGVPVCAWPALQFGPTVSRCDRCAPLRHLRPPRSTLTFSQPRRLTYVPHAASGHAPLYVLQPVPRALPAEHLPGPPELRWRTPWRR